MSTHRTAFHVYAEDGFESAHRTQRAAETAALRGSRTRRMDYRVVETDRYEWTGGGHGATVARFHIGQRRPE